MVNSTDGPDEGVRLCVTELTRCSLDEWVGTLPQVSKTFPAENLDGLLLIPDNDERDENDRPDQVH